MGRPKMTEEAKLAAKEARMIIKNRFIRELAVERENEAIEHLNDNSEMIQRVKDNPLPKIKEEVIDLAPEMKSVAYGMALDQKTGQWFAIKIMFDLASGTSSAPMKFGDGDIKAIARERMLIDQANKIFGD